ncbi:MAG: serine hydrolase [Cyanobacteria bacterium J06621_11]
MGYGVSYFSRFLRVAIAYKAKLLCSGIFVSGRTESALLEEDFVEGLALLKLLKSTVDYEQKTVTVSFLGWFACVALYRPGLGSTLVIGCGVEEVRSQSKNHATEKQQPLQSLPIFEKAPTGVDIEKLTNVTDGAFVESDLKRLKRTRAVLVLHKGQIISERYASGFSADMPLLGWSMAKSVVNALIGILIQQGKLSLNSKDLLAEWRTDGDSRREITIEHLLRMSSGLKFSENYASPLSDVTTMLFQVGDAAHYTAQLPLAATPGHTFSYAGGSTVLLCRIIREILDGSLADYLTFPKRALFDRLGMTSAVLEPDAAGTFIGSSFMYATARDWAKLGLLYLQDGCWRRENQWQRILPKGWVQYSVAPSETANFYGAHFWRGVPNSFTTKQRDDTNWPQGAFLAAGFQGQFITVVPEYDLVAVRLGLSQRKHSWNQTQFVSQIVGCFTQSTPALTQFAPS